jgi:hypothetical protein
MVFSLVLVVICFLSSCYGVSYDCAQFVSINGVDHSLTYLNFKTRKQYDAFREENDTIHVNDSTLVYWDCAMSK